MKLNNFLQNIKGYSNFQSSSFHLNLNEHNSTLSKSVQYCFGKEYRISTCHFRGRQQQQNQNYYKS